MTDGDNQNVFANFMSSKKEESDGGSSSFLKNEAKEKLNEKKDEEDKKKDEELQDAKKKASATLNRNKGLMMQAQAYRMLKLLPFIIFGVFILMMILFKGGDIMKFVMNGLLKSLTGQK
jgi:hypothetical protein